MDNEVRRSLDELVATNHRLISLQHPWRYFFRGVVSGVGATVGAALAIALLASLLHYLAGIDIFRPFATGVLPFVERQGRGILTGDELVAPVYINSPALPTPESTISPTAEPSAESTAEF